MVNTQLNVMARIVWYNVRVGNFRRHVSLACSVILVLNYENVIYVEIAVLQIGRSLVRSQLVSVDFSLT